MKTRLIGLAAVGLLASLAAGEALAQRGPRPAPPRGGTSGRPAVGTPHRATGPVTLPSRAGVTNPAGPRVHPPTGTRPAGPATPQHIRSFIGSNHPPIGHPPRPAGLAWINPKHKPFSPAWYKAHPNAWRVTHPHAPAVVAVTALGVARWFGAPYASTTTTTVTTGTATSEPADAADEAFQLDTEAASDPTEWLNLGAFALKPAGQTKATRVIQLAVSRDGALGGAHYDLISDQVLDVRGTVDKSNLQVAWTVGEEGTVVFRAPFDELTRPQGNVTAEFPGGQTASWQTVQVTQ